MASDFTGAESPEFALTLPRPERALWLARRIELYRESTVTYAATLLRERGDKKTVAEAEAQAVLETDGFTKSFALESALYPVLFGEDIEGAEVG